MERIANVLAQNGHGQGMTDQSGTIERLVDRLIPGCLRPFWDRLRASNIGYRLALGAFWSTIGAGVSQILMLVSSIIIARILGREHFGEYGIVLSTVGVFNVVAGFGLGTTATKFVAEYKRTDPARAGRIIALSNIVAMGTGTFFVVVLLVIAPWLSTSTLAAPQISGLIQIGACIVLFSAVNSSQIGALAGFEAFRGIAKLNLINGILMFLLVAGGVLLWGIVGAMIGQVVSMGISCIFAIFALRSEARRYSVPLEYAGCWAERSVLTSFSLPAVLAGIMVSPVTWACSAILVNEPNGYAEMGIFSAANSWQKVILFLPGCLSVMALPMLSELYGKNDRRTYLKALWYNILLNSGVAFTVACCVAAVSVLIMRCYGENFSSGVIVLVLLSFSAALNASVSVIGQAIASIGKMWWGWLLNFVWAIVILVGAWILRHDGASGLALAYLISYVIHFINVTIVTNVYIKKYCNQ